MSLLTNHPSKTTSKKVVRCADCRKPLNNGGQHIEGLHGVFGPTCYRKYAAYPQVLGRAGLGEFLTAERVTFDLLSSTDANGDAIYYKPEVLMEMEQSALRLGMSLTLVRRGDRVEAYLVRPTRTSKWRKLAGALEGV